MTSLQMPIYNPISPIGPMCPISPIPIDAANPSQIGIPPIPPHKKSKIGLGLWHSLQMPRPQPYPDISSNLPQAGELVLRPTPRRD